MKMTKKRINTSTSRAEQTLLYQDISYTFDACFSIRRKFTTTNKHAFLYIYIFLSNPRMPHSVRSPCCYCSRWCWKHIMWANIRCKRIDVPLCSRVGGTWLPWTHKFEREKKKTVIAMERTSNTRPNGCPEMSLFRNDKIHRQCHPRYSTIYTGGGGKYSHARTATTNKKEKMLAAGKYKVVNVLN